MAAGPNGRFVILQADPSPPPAERYAIHGRVLVDRRPQREVVVHVGDRSVRTNDDGRYRVRGRARGMVHVWVEPSLSPRPDRVLNFEPEHWVELSGKHGYRRDLVTHTVLDDH